MFDIDPTVRAGRMLAAGRVTVTFRSPSGQHITLLAKCRTIDADDKWVASSLDEAKVVFVEVPSEGGWNDKVGKITRSKGFVPAPNADPARVWCARQLLAHVAGQPVASGLEVFEEDRCGVCGRALTDPVSIERGIGPECNERATGSEHQAKAKPEVATDRKNVPYGHGDWRARNEVATQAAKEDAKPKASGGWSQLADLPGETWEDIFAK